VSVLQPGARPIDQRHLSLYAFGRFPMAKLWQKDYSLNRLIEAFTAGKDPLLDQKLVNADCVASIAHAEMLKAIGILSDREFSGLKRELLAIVEKNEGGEFPIKPEDEDCHTAIENHLTETLGESGKRIHTGRSRNDQVIAALRLYVREFLLAFQRSCLQLATTLLRLAERHKELPMPGRTHMQIAMPSSVGLWSAAYAEEILDDLEIVQTAYRLNNTCPLGSAASYGVPIPLDRERTARALAFDRVQNNVLYVNNSRGKVEAVVLEAVDQVMLTLSRLSQDLILFSMPEFHYFTLPEEICTGSSIMPQKKNPDALELIRAKAATVTALSSGIKSVLRGLPSGYNRDVQETKAALMEGLEIGLASVRVMDLVMDKLKVNEETLRESFTPEIFATDRAIEMAAEGKPFRDAYREVSSHLAELEGRDPTEAIRAKSYQGAPGNLRLDLAEKEIQRLEAWLDQEEQRVRKTLQALTGRRVKLFQ
jgi:argininosuccinate lyase